MKNNVLIILIITLVIISGCSKIENDSTKIKVSTSLYPWYDFTREIGKEKIIVDLIIPEGSNPHTYEPKPSDIIKISNSDIFIYTGESMEPWVLDIIKGINNNKLVIIEAAEYSDLIRLEHHDELNEEEHHNDELNEEEYHNETNEDNHELNEEHNHGEYDPHIWLDFENNKKIIDVITLKLSELDYDNKDYYINNSNKLKEELNKLKEEYQVLKNCNKNKFITNHKAFSYLIRDLEIEEISIYGITADSEPTPKKIIELIEVSRKENLSYIFFESNIDPKIANVFAKELNATLLNINPGHNVKTNASFINVMRENLVSLKKGLECYDK